MCEKPSCGKYAGGCRCEGCCAAQQKYNAEYYRQNREAILQRLSKQRELKLIASGSCETPSYGRYVKGCRCGGCRNAKRLYMNDYNQRRPEHVMALSRERSFRYNLRKRYKLTLDEYSDMLERQGHGCAICRKTSNGRRLSVDHCHETGNIRGLLCDASNTSIGKFENNPDRLRVAIAYLERR